MNQCKLCLLTQPAVSEALGVCLRCIREKPEEALPIAMTAHKKSRVAFGLPQEPPRDPGGIPCKVCQNECRMLEGETGYCGLRKNERGRLVGISPEEGKLSWYFDALPTNCVGDWSCAGGTGAGYPKYACRPGPEYGHKNLAVFFHGCSFNCLYCQNWQFKKETLKPHTRFAHELVFSVDEETSCICYFGGDPTPQLPFSIKASRTALEENKGRILRTCWETNGSMHPRLLDRIIEIALISGGCVKFDLKAWDENLHIALTGVPNKRTLENFQRAGKRIEERPVPPLLIASTLLVPGYIDVTEIRRIAGFVSSVNPNIPYSLLAFHPCFSMSDLPLFSKQEALECLEAARGAGLKNVRLGNTHLLA
jgi:pyruvate formate lyase activating enzyme